MVGRRYGASRGHRRYELDVWPTHGAWGNSTGTLPHLPAMLDGASIRVDRRLHILWLLLRLRHCLPDSASKAAPPRRCSILHSTSPTEQGGIVVGSQFPSISAKHDVSEQEKEVPVSRLRALDSPVGWPLKPSSGLRYHIAVPSSMVSTLPLRGQPYCGSKQRRVARSRLQWPPRHPPTALNHVRHQRRGQTRGISSSRSDGWKRRWKGRSKLGGV